MHLCWKIETLFFCSSTALPKDLLEYNGVLRTAKFRDIYFGESPVPGLKGVITKKIAHSLTFTNDATTTFQL